MTLNLLTDSAVAGRIETASTDYPYGTYRDKSSQYANDGTPAAIARLNIKDWDGFRQYLLSKNKVTPSGNPDTAAASQIAESLYTSYEYRGFRAYHPSAPAGSTGGYANALLQANGIQHNRAYGSNYRQYVVLVDGGIKFSGLSPGSAVTMRRERFDIGLTQISINATTKVLTFYPTGTTEGQLNGIPFKDSLPQHVSLMMSGNDGTRDIYELITLDCSFAGGVGGGGDLEIVIGKGVVASGYTIDKYTSACLFVDYSPAEVD